MSRQSDNHILRQQHKAEEEMEHSKHVHGVCEGRVRSGPHIAKDASRWMGKVAWTDASKLAPVYGYLVLIADSGGYVNVLDLRHPDGESPGDISADTTFSRTREALIRHRAKWWAYLPLSPPLNVQAIPWHIGADGNPVVKEADDPPKRELRYAYNLPHNIVR